MADAFAVDAHPIPDDGRTSALRFPREAGLPGFASANASASASLGRRALARSGELPDAMDGRLAGDAPAQRAIDFARSAPGVTAALVGTTDPDHLDGNVAAGTLDPMGAAAFDATFE